VTIVDVSDVTVDVNETTTGTTTIIVTKPTPGGTSISSNIFIAMAAFVVLIIIIVVSVVCVRQLHRRNAANAGKTGLSRPFVSLSHVQCRGISMIHLHCISIRNH